MCSGAARLHVTKMRAQAFFKNFEQAALSDRSLTHRHRTQPRTPSRVINTGFLPSTSVHSHRARHFDGGIRVLKPSLRVGSTVQP